MADFQISFKENSSRSLPIANSGIIYYEQGNVKESIRQFQQALRINETSAEINLLMAISLNKTGNSLQGKEFAKTALKLDPSIADPEVQRKKLWGEKLIADAQKLLSKL